ncbi:Alpha/beta hydrolase fold protein [metagenome]|uniref:Alpha/beta hydrolase fold protein n=1 Tax=metagenome TaxID=256318 RepID=A0A2P2C9U0_9ZZZZ
MVVENVISRAATRGGITHNTAEVNGTTLHYVTAGDDGSPILLVHGFPETWCTFRALIPLLAERHRVFAADLRGFGDSGRESPLSSVTVAEDLAQLVAHLALGPVHLAAQDIGGGAAFRFASQHPDLVASFTAIEMGLAGFGLEAFADVKNGGSWHIGAFATPGIAQMLLAGHERQFLTGWYQAMTAQADSVTDQDLDELVRTYSRPNGWQGAAGLYGSMLAEGEELRELAASAPIAAPALAIGGGGGTFTFSTLSQVTTAEPEGVQIDGVGHHVALEAPDRLAHAMNTFFESVDGRAVPGQTA